MSILSLQSPRSFHQFRVAVYGVTSFLRLAWAFLLALNAFSLTTQIDPEHRGVSIFMFSVNAAAFAMVAIVGLLEAFKAKVARVTSQVRFEIGWMSVFWILETAGATMFTILRSSFSCNNILRITGDATGAIFAADTTLSHQRPTTPGEAHTCNISNLITFIGSWVAVGFSLLYTVYFTLLCLKAYKRDPSIWHSQINKIDWSITSEPVDPPSEQAHPEMIQRPMNPHLSKDYNNDSMLSLPPVFVDPFDIRKESFDSAASSKKAMHMDRHQIMAQYQPTAPAFEPSFRPLVLPNIVQQHRNTMQSSIGGFSALGLEGMDRPASEFRKSRPTLSIHVPKQESETVVPIGAGDEDYARIGRHLSAGLIASPESRLTVESSEEPCAKIGRHMSMPFASPITSDESGSSASQSSPEAGRNSSNLAIVSHVSVSNATQRSASSGQVNAYTTNIPAIQTVNAANGYPTVQHTPKRQSTLVRQDSMTARRAMKFLPNVPQMPFTNPAARNSGILPLHTQDLPVTTGQHQRYYQSHALHTRSRSDGFNVQPSYAPQHAAVNTWPTQGYIYQEQVPIQRRGQAPTFRAPPPPNYSPVYASSTSSMQGYMTHSRSSSAPSQPMTAPVPALLEALRPVLRNSGIYQTSAAPSPYESRPSSAVPYPNPYDNPMRSAPHTPTSYEEMSVRMSRGMEIDQERRKSQRSSRLRKSMPRERM